MGYSKCELKQSKDSLKSSEPSIEHFVDNFEHSVNDVHHFDYGTLKPSRHSHFSLERIHSHQ